MNLDITDRDLTRLEDALENLQDGGYCQYQHEGPDSPRIILDITGYDGKAEGGIETLIRFALHTLTACYTE